LEHGHSRTSLTSPPHSRRSSDSALGSQPLDGPTRSRASWRRSQRPTVDRPNSPVTHLRRRRRSVRVLVLAGAADGVVGGLKGRGEEVEFEVAVVLFGGGDGAVAELAGELQSCSVVASVSAAQPETFAGGRNRQSRSCPSDHRSKRRKVKRQPLAVRSSLGFIERLRRCGAWVAVRVPGRSFGERDVDYQNAIGCRVRARAYTAVVRTDGRCPGCGRRCARAREHRRAGAAE
jgi:hypothetical protein